MLSPLDVMKKSTKIWITAGAIVVVTAVVLSVLKKFKGVMSFKKGYSTKLQGDSIITIPHTNFPKNDVVIVYGGLHYATPRWMYEQLSNSTAKELMYTSIFIFVPYNTVDELPAKSSYVKFAPIGRMLSLTAYAIASNMSSCAPLGYIVISSSSGAMNGADAGSIIRPAENKGSSVAILGCFPA